MTKPKMSARDAAVDVLKKADGPLAMSEIADRVLAHYQTGLGAKGKTPKATIGAQVYLAAKNGVLFKKTGRGEFDLLNRDGQAAPAEASADGGGKSLAEDLSPVKGAVVVKDGRQAKPHPKPASGKGKRQAAKA